jgi:6-hydroxycyclohex-1-ene-1-carbonyl-CoA dehydrogenase
LMPSETEFIQAHGWHCVAVGKPLVHCEWQIDTSELAGDEVVVEVAGCGVCHTDLGFHYDGVRTKKPLPLILGHEISGTVVAAGADSSAMLGQNVVIPAVLPCGECVDCSSGRSNVCRSQIMPGNDVDGGFASHIRVPSRWMVPVPESYSGDLALLSVVADAISTPWQSLQRAEVAAGDICIIIGCGGVGGYSAQLAHSLGANVIGIDVNPARLQALADIGFENLIDSSDLSNRDIRGQLKELAKQNSWPRAGWKIFECSGHPAGQTLAFEMLGPSGTLAVVGFTMEKVTIRLSNLMAHDAKAFGNWGCQPELYPALLKEVIRGAVNLEGTTEKRPLNEINEVFETAHCGGSSKRIILVPS